MGKAEGPRAREADATKASLRAAVAPAIRPASPRSREAEMRHTMLLKTGIAGSVIAAICCATPVLTVLLAAVGLSAWVGGLDYVLLPALAFFLGLTGWALWRRQKAAECCGATRQPTTRS
jgi:mercuric ion transport protein